MKVKGQLFYFVPLTIPCVKPEFKYIFPLESARIVDGGILAKTPVEVKMSINGFRIDTLNTLFNMVLKSGDVIEFSHKSEDMPYIQFILKCPMRAE